jgi:N-acetylneuraminate synthase
MSLNLEERDRAFVIAEAGTCHANRDPEARFRRAMKYTHAAVRARADAVKFQLFWDPNPDTMFCWIDGDEARAARWRQSALSLKDWMAVKDEAESCGLMFLASTFEHETVAWLSELEVQATKVASRAAAYLSEFENAPRPLLISDGMREQAQYNDGAVAKVILECEANYPSTAHWANHHTGFSDHSANPWRAIDAMARGCKLIEVHYYIDPLHAGPDFPASLSIEDLELVCKARDNFASI